VRATSFPDRQEHMARHTQWTNLSVLAFADGEDPVNHMEAKARELALKAMDDGWDGPPYDPLALARWIKLPVEARADIPDARTVPTADGKLLLEYNPMRPRGRLRFSIAHEIAHTLFADCAAEVRNRGSNSFVAPDNWQLEVLCNIGAAELLMPLGSFSELAGEELSIKSAGELRKRFDISMEACLIRLVKLARTRCAAFGASKHSDGKYRVDYVIPAPGWINQVPGNDVVPEGSAISEATAIGFTSIGDEVWGDRNLRVECIGLAPYPESITPRVVGILIDREQSEYRPPEIKEVMGDALQPHGTGPKLIAHVVPDTGGVWGGNGFASQVRRRFPDVWTQFKYMTAATPRSLPLGSVFLGTLSNEISIAHMVAQRGIGASQSPRLRYAALAACLSQVCAKAQERGASVHMPRVGTGHGGASWQLVREMISAELVDKGISTTVYTPPK
jgi:O-acetyl-ADP-ribose deacetylase (regulator of RNase III)